MEPLQPHNVVLVSPCCGDFVSPTVQYKGMHVLLLHVTAPRNSAVTNHYFIGVGKKKLVAKMPSKREDKIFPVDRLPRLRPIFTSKDSGRSQVPYGPQKRSSSHCMWCGDNSLSLCRPCLSSYIGRVLCSGCYSVKCLGE